jgi:integrase/recombinase XerD
VLTIYRRHQKSCRHRAKGRKYRACRCVIWADGFLGGKEIRQTLDTRDWQLAQDKIRKWEAEGSIKPDEREVITVEQATKDFLADVEARKLKSSTLERYKILFRQLAVFAKNAGIRHLEELDTPTLRQFRTTWKDGDLAGLKKLERLRTFFRFARDNKWIAENPAAVIKNPKITPRPTLPFSQQEMLRILATANQRIGKVRSDGRNRARRLRALVLLLRYTGLRISDAISCPTERLKDGKIWLYTHKTGQHVYCPLPGFVVKELESTPKLSDQYWFWNGSGSLETTRKKWSESLATLFAEAKVDDGHAHRFRDTFATELLLSGTPIESVSAFLGHASIRVTERYYSPWVRARQDQAEAEVQRSWSRDLVVRMEQQGTQEVHQ